jgi:hypothetical protein
VPVLANAWITFSPGIEATLGSVVCSAEQFFIRVSHSSLAPSRARSFLHFSPESNWFMWNSFRICTTNAPCSKLTRGSWTQIWVIIDGPGMDRDLVQSLQLQQVSLITARLLPNLAHSTLLVSTVIEPKRAKIYGFTVVVWCLRATLFTCHVFSCTSCILTAVGTYLKWSINSRH